MHLPMQYNCTSQGTIGYDYIISITKKYRRENRDTNHFHHLFQSTKDIRVNNGAIELYSTFHRVSFYKQYDQKGKRGFYHSTL